MRFFALAVVLGLSFGCGPKATAEKYLRLIAEGKLDEAETLLEPASAAYVGPDGLKITYPDLIPPGHVNEVKVVGIRAQVQRSLDSEGSKEKDGARSTLGDLTHKLIVSKGPDGWKILDCAVIGYLVIKQVGIKDFERAQSGITLLKDGRCDEALVPKLEGWMLTERGTSYYDQGVYEKATEALQRALQLSPSAILHYHLGYVFRDNKSITNNVSRAIEEFKTAVEMEPKNPGFRGSLADAYRQSGNLDGALIEFKEALALNPNDVQTRYFYAMTLVQKEWLSDAVKELRRVVTLDPNYRDARERISKIHQYQVSQARLRALRSSWRY